MSRPILVISAAVFLMAGGSKFALAGPEPVFELSHVINRADTICVVKVTKVTTQSKGISVVGSSHVNVINYAATCQAVSVFKGELKAKSILVDFAQSVEEPLDLDRLTKDEIAVVLLKKNGDVYTFSDKMHGTIPLSKFYSESDDIHASPVDRIDRQLVAALGGADDKAVARTLSSLYNLHLSAPAASLRPLLVSHASDVQSGALKLLIVQRDKNGIRLAGAALVGEDRAMKLTANEKGDIAWALAAVPKSVPLEVANNIVLTGDEQINLAGVTILKDIGDRTSISALAKALESSNTDTRYQAIVALSRIGNHPGPAWRAFQKDPNTFTKEWLTWAKSQLSTTRPK